jgi:KRAB domain-containing zinc finger protein
VHERRHFGNKSHECNVCGHEFSRASSLKQHILMHAGDGEFFCHECGLTFSKLEDLSSHSATHTRDREFACDQCGKAFAIKVMILAIHSYILLLNLLLH